MSPHRDAEDAWRHRNLERIGRRIALPERPSAERQAAWQMNLRLTPSAEGPRGRSFMRTHKPFAFATSGAAAVVLVVIWLATGHTTTVSAAVVFRDLKAALARSLSIRLSNIDLGTVQVNGTLALDRATAAETRYAELHVLLKPDHPEWENLDAALVMCQTPTSAWQYCRFSGGSCASQPEPAPGQVLNNQRYRVTPSEYLQRDVAWRDFAGRPLDQFGGMPLEFDCDVGNSAARYEFGQAQRTIVEELMRFLLELSDPQTAGRVLDDLLAASSSVTMQRTDSSTYRHEAAQFARLGQLDLADPVVPDVSDLVRQYVWTAQYDPEAKRITATSGRSVPGLYESGVTIVADSHSFDELSGSPEELIAHPRARAENVQVDQSAGRMWTIRVTGYPFPVDTSNLDWRRDFVRKLRGTLTLTIQYDAARRDVQHAEFRGLGPADGRITLEIGPVQLDASRLDPGYWTSGDRAATEPAGGAY